MSIQLARRIDADNKYQLFRAIETFINIMPSIHYVTNIFIEDSYALIIWEIRGDQNDSR